MDMHYRIETNHKDMWKVINTDNNNLIFDFDNEKELMLWLSKYVSYGNKRKTIEMLLNISNPSKGDNYSTWFNSLPKFKTSEDLFKAIDNKLKELTK